MKTFLFGAIVLGCVVIAAADGVDDMAARFVTTEASRLGGHEYQGARQVKRSESSANGTITFAIVYTIEGIGGGNNYSQYLVAFLNTDASPTTTRPVLVGGGGYRAVQLDQVAAKKITLKTKNYRTADASCCPSLDGRSWYWLTDGELHEGPGLRFAP